MKPDTVPPKRLGCCVCCGTEVYEVRERNAEDIPIVLGPMLEHGCQIELLMSDGSEASIACCIECAAKIAPADYQRIWESCVDAADGSLKQRSRNDRIYLLRQQMAVWPIALVRKRREGPVPGGLIVDRR